MRFFFSFSPGKELCELIIIGKCLMVPFKHQANRSALNRDMARRPLKTKAFSFTNSSVENSCQEWQRSSCWFVPSFGDSSRQFYHPAVLFFKTKVIGIEL